MRVTSQCAIPGATPTILAAMTPAGMILTFTRSLWPQAGVAWAAAIIVVTVGALVANLGEAAPLLGLFATFTFVEAVITIASAAVVMRRREHNHA